MKTTELCLMLIGTSCLWGEGKVCVSGNQRSRSHKAEDRFVELAETPFSTALCREGFLISHAEALSVSQTVERLTGHGS